jgi:DNA invertase Pin-like site-specific DNA recombinase
MPQGRLPIAAPRGLGTRSAASQTVVSATRCRKAGERPQGCPQAMSEINVAPPALSHGCATLPGMGHVLGYARVSTTDQHPDLQVDALNPGRPLPRVHRHRQRRRRRTGRRPERDRVLDQLRPGDTLVVWKLDRLGRSLRHLVDTVTALADRGVGFRSLQEAIDTTIAGGKLVFHIFAALAEFERDLIRERTRAGLAAARARGRHGGRPSVMTPDKVRVVRQPTVAGGAHPCVGQPVRQAALVYRAPPGRGGVLVAAGVGADRGRPADPPCLDLLPLGGSSLPPPMTASRA